MFYDFAVVIPANTLESAPVKQTLKLTHGVLHRVEVQFPIGTQALTHCQIYIGGHQLYPTNPDGDFASDGYVIPIDDYFELTAEPYSLKVIAWNDDDTYAHTLTFRVGILSQEVISPFFGIGGMLRKFLRLVGIGG